MKTLGKHTWRSLALLGLLLPSLLLVSIPTDTLLAYIGTDNAYVFMYTIAFIGSISTFASIPYPLLLLSLVAGGLHPIAAGLCSALGVITADTITFIAAGRGRALLSEQLLASLATVTRTLERYPKLLTPGLIMYGTFSPLSNDFAVIGLSLMRYSFFQVIPALALGNVVYNVGIALIGVYAYDWIINLL